MKILWVKAGKLLPVNTGGRIRSYNILKHLARDHQVTLLSYYSGPADVAYEQELCRHLPGAHPVCTGGNEGSTLRQSVNYLKRVLNPAPFAVSKFADLEIRRLLESWLGDHRFDVAVCDFLSASRNFPESLATPTVLFQHNVETALWQRMASAERNPARRLIYAIEAAKMKRYERAALGRFHHTIAVSDNDRDQMLQMCPRCQVSVVPTGVDISQFEVAPPASGDPPRIVFTGSMDWEPNIEAVVYFCASILPLILSEFPQARFQVVGRNPHPRIRRLAGDHVEVTGTVPSVADYLRDATAVIVPLLAGGGTRLKIFEAMAMGKAMVSTSIGAEGLPVNSGRDLILADDAASFAAAVRLLLRDARVRREYELAALQLARQYDWSQIVPQFAAILSRAMTSLAGGMPSP